MLILNPELPPAEEQFVGVFQELEKTINQIIKHGCRGWGRLEGEFVDPGER